MRKTVRLPELIGTLRLDLEVLPVNERPESIAFEVLFSERVDMRHARVADLTVHEVIQSSGSLILTGKRGSG